MHSLGLVFAFLQCVCVLHPRIGAVLLIIVCANQFKIAGVQIRIVAQQLQIGENIADAVV